MLTRSVGRGIIKMQHEQMVVLRKGDGNLKTILKTTREKKGFTQVEVADKANITVRAYQRYEAGERVPNVHTALNIAKVLNTRIEVLFPVTVPDNFKSK